MKGRFWWLLLIGLVLPVFANTAFAQTVTASSLDMAWLTGAWQYAFGLFNILSPVLKIGVGFVLAGLLIAGFMGLLNWGRRSFR